MPILTSVGFQVLRRLAKARLRWGREPDGLIVLTLHHVFESEAESRSGLVDPMQGTTLADLRFLLEYFESAGYRLIAPTEIERALAGGKSLLLTFDDGYADNLRAQPLLEAIGVPALVFVSTGHVLEQKCFWWDVLYRERVRQGTPMDAILKEQERLRALPYPELEPYLRQTFGEAALRPRGEIDRPMTAAELADLSRRPNWFVGNHTHDHAILTNCTDEQVRDQILRCQTILGELTGQQPACVSYPGGYFSNSILEIVQQCELTFGFTMIPRKNLPAFDGDASPVLALGRFLPDANRPLRAQCEIFRANAMIRRPHLTGWKIRRQAAEAKPATSTTP